MKRSWLIGAALVLSLTAVGCKDDEEDDVTTLPDSSVPAKDGGNTPTTDAGGGIDGGGRLDGSVPDAAVPADASTTPDASTTTTDAGGLDAG